MSQKSNDVRANCLVCGKNFPRRELVAGGIVRPTVAQRIVEEHPSWSADAFICLPDLARPAVGQDSRL